MNSKRNFLASLRSQLSETLDFLEMEIDLTQSDDEEETSKEVGRRASYRPQQAAVPDLVASNSNLQSIDRMPTSLPPPLEPIDMRIPIKNK